MKKYLRQLYVLEKKERIRRCNQSLFLWVDLNLYPDEYPLYQVCQTESAQEILGLRHYTQTSKWQNWFCQLLWKYVFTLSPQFKNGLTKLLILHIYYNLNPQSCADRFSSCISLSCTKTQLNLFNTNINELSLLQSTQSFYNSKKL